MAIVAPDPAVTDLLAKLGLLGRDVTSLTLKILPDALATLTIEKLVSRSELETITEHIHLKLGAKK